MRALHSSQRNYALDFLKCIATIAIVFHHYQQETGAMFRFNFCGGWFYWGYVVELFFLISGYVICRYVTVIYQGKMSLKQWTLKRTLRCIPMMAAGALAYEIFLYINNNVCGLSWSGITPTLWGTVIASLGLQANGFFANPWVNNPTWYISVLFLCYVLFYLATALARKWKVSPAYFYIGMVLLGCGIEAYGLNWLILEGQLARGYRGFFFGLLLAMLIEKQGGKPSGKLCLLSGAALITVALAYVFDKTLLENNVQYIVTFLVFPALIVMLETSVARRIFSSRIWGAWGKASFDVYIFHIPLMILANVLFYAIGWSPDYSKVRYMLLFTLATELVGIISHYCIEKPIARRVNGWLQRMEAQEAACKSDL